MKDDELTRGIAAALAQESRDTERDSKWEALCKNELTAGERAELEALAARDPSAADALEVYAPLGSEYEEQIAQSFLASETAAPRALNAAASAGPIAVSKREATPRAKSGNVVRIGTFVAAPLAIAAGIALFLGQGGDSSNLLPPYAIALSSNVHAERGPESPAAGSEARIHSKAYFEIVARPSLPPHQPIDARAALVRNGRASAWNVPIAISEEGSVRIAGRADALFPEANGSYEIVVALASKSALPDERALLALAADGASVPPSIRVLRAHVDIIAE